MRTGDLSEKLLHDRTLTLAHHLHDDYKIGIIPALRALNKEMERIIHENPLYSNNKPYCLEQAYKQLREAYSKVK